MRLVVSLLDSGALLLLGAWMYMNGMPDWTTQTGEIIIGSTLIIALNLGYLVFARRRHSPTSGQSAGYASALAAIADARQSSLEELRQATVQALYDHANPQGSLSAHRLVEAASLLERKGEYDRVMRALADAPVALEIMSLAGEGNAATDDDAMIRLEGLLAFIHASEPVDFGVEILEGTDIRLDSLYPEAAFDMSTDYAQEISSSDGEPRSAARSIDYEDVVNATLRIVPIEKITGLALVQRRALFSRVRNIMEKSGSVPDASQVEEIKAWVSENTY